MQVTVVAVTGQKYTFSLAETDTVAKLKALIWKHENVLPYHQGLIFQNHQLDCDERLLTDYGICSGSRINLALLARSGPLKLSKASSDVSSSSKPLSYVSEVKRPSSSYQNSDTDRGSHGELDFSFTAERRVAAKTRAEENLKTMAKMKELRQNLEKLKLEKKNRTGSIPGETTNVEGTVNMNKVQRKAACSSNSGAVRIRSPNSVSAIAPALLSAPEDTSAKESSAGETEYEEWRPSGPVTLRDYFYRNTESSIDPDNDKIEHFPATHDSSSPVLRRGNMGQQNYGAFQPYKNISASRGGLVRVVSSSSEPESSGALWTGSDLEDDILYTADEEPLELVNVPSSLNSRKAYSPDVLQDTVEYSPEIRDNFYSGDSDTNNEFGGPNTVISSSVGKDRDTLTSDPSELSSGMIICDLTNDYRRVKVKRRHHLPGKSAGVAYSSIAQGMPSALGRPQRRGQWRGQVWKNRPRSRPRQFQNPSGSVACGVKPPRLSTGESSSDPDEKEGWSSGGGGRTGFPKLPVGQQVRQKLRSVPGSLSRAQGDGPVVRHHKLPQSSQSQVRCNTCGCKLSIPSTFQCRCGKTLCIRHRSQDMHVCFCDSTK